MNEISVKAENIREQIVKALRRNVGVTPEEASAEEIYQAAGQTIRARIFEKWAEGNKRIDERKSKKLYYLSAEFLMGKAFVNNLVSLDLLGQYREALESLGVSLDALEEAEPEPGLGNGGLGRLAACFLDSLSTLDLPATGNGIRYEYGLFRQVIENGEQKEVGDDWLAGGSLWEVHRPEWKETVVFYGNKEVEAVPHDYPVMGYESSAPATLRLWRAKAKLPLDLSAFNKGEYAKAGLERELVESISQVLYPGDSSEGGKKLRLRQFYFLASASMQHMLRKAKKLGVTAEDFPKHWTIQINDTHPALAIPELLRLLVEREKLSFDRAFAVCEKMFFYTNHTVMPEALEKWKEEDIAEMLPDVYEVIKLIDKKTGAGIICDGQIKMANLCIAVCPKVNGVSKLHSEILAAETFKPFAEKTPGKFIGITNGVTHRRWLGKANPELTALIRESAGDFLKSYSRLGNAAAALEADPEKLEAFASAAAKIKGRNKLRLRDHLLKKQGIEIDPSSIIDTQAKRLHEYKRQLLKAFHILKLYLRIKTGKKINMPRTTFIFAGKAYPGYNRAKELVRLILAIASLVNNDAEASKFMQVVFLADYNVSEAEILMPATDISEQISTAGYEASGTGNMKFMMNGAVTLGTLDGANIEIKEKVGGDNIFIFGADAAEVKAAGESYSPPTYMEEDEELKSIMAMLISGELTQAGAKNFSDIYNSLISEDKYLVLYDLASYDERFADCVRTYQDKEQWNKISALNILRSGHFSSDRTIEEYNELLWGLDRVCL